MLRKPQLGGDRSSRGTDLLTRIGGPDALAPLTAIEPFAPRMVRFAVEFAYGEVLWGPELDLTTRQLCTVGALTAIGHAEPQRRWHTDGARRVGARDEELAGAAELASWYAGRDQTPAAELGAGLDPLRRAFVSIAVLTALGTRPGLLGGQIRAARQAGSSIGQIIAVIEQMAVYAGFPAALNAIAVARGVLEGAESGGSDGASSWNPLE